MSTSIHENACWEGLTQCARRSISQMPVCGGLGYNFWALGRALQLLRCAGTFLWGSRDKSSAAFLSQQPTFVRARKKIGRLNIKVNFIN